MIWLNLANPEGRIGAAVTTRSGRRDLVTADHKIAFVDWATGKSETVVDLQADSQARLNDAKCDSAGRLWTG